MECVELGSRRCHLEWGQLLQMDSSTTLMHFAVVYCVLLQIAEKRYEEETFFSCFEHDYNKEITRVVGCFSGSFYLFSF